MKTIRWGMIGCGSVCEVKSGPGFYKAAHSALVAVASARVASARAYAARHGVARVYATPAELVLDADVDIVYIATPPSTHKAVTLLALEAGKHVYVEKPMALDHAECEAMIDAARQRQRALHVAFYRRAMPRFLQVKQWIDAGAIGAIRCVRITQHQRPGDDERSRNTLPWRVRPEISGGGKFVDMGVHQLDFCAFVFGAIADARGIAANHAGLYDAEDTVGAAWRHESGVTGVGSWCYVCGEEADRMEIEGADGRIELEFFTDAPLRIITRNGTRDVAIANPAHVQQPLIQSIVDELNGTGRCPCDTGSAARTAWVVDAILRDYRNSRRA